MQKNSIKAKLILLSVIATLGIIVSALLTSHFYELRSGFASFSSYCNINQTLNCDAVAASPYAELFAGLPISSFAAGWFLALLLVSLLAHSFSWRQEAIRIAFGMSLIGTILGFAYLGIMAFQLHTYCLQCLIIDALNVGALLCTLSLKPQSFKKLKPNLTQWKIGLGTVLGSLFVAVIALGSFDQINVRASDVSLWAESVLNTPVLPIKTSETGPSIGPKTAPIIIAEFSDFQCPHCRRGAQLLNVIVDRYPGKVRVEFHNYPLDPSCNPEIKQSAHSVSCEAAKTVLCAHKQGKFQPVFEALFERQSSLRPGLPAQIAQENGVDLALLKTCVASPETQTEILKDIQEGTAHNLKATPTFFVNGHRMEGPYPLQAWDKIINQLLKNAAH